MDIERAFLRVSWTIHRVLDPIRNIALVILSPVADEGDDGSS